jgi:hypothetical protein
LDDINIVLNNKKKIDTENLLENPNLEDKTSVVKFVGFEEDKQNININHKNISKNHGEKHSNKQTEFD